MKYRDVQSQTFPTIDSIKKEQILKYKQGLSNEKTTAAIGRATGHPGRIRYELDFYSFYVPVVPVEVRTLIGPWGHPRLLGSSYLENFRP